MVIIAPKPKIINKKIIIDKKPQEKIQKCPECGSEERETRTETGELICRSCGLVVADHAIDYGAEWRSFTPEEYSRKARTGSPLNIKIADYGLSTTIGSRKSDIRNASSSAERRRLIYRLRKWQRRSTLHGSRDRNLFRALTELRRLGSQLHIPNAIMETTAHLYRRLITLRITQGYTINSMITATIYLACRQHGLPRTLDEVAKASHVTRKDLARAIRHIIRYLDEPIAKARPEDFIPRIATELQISGEVQITAKRLIERAREKGITIGKAPNGLAAAALYLASLIHQQNQTQRTLSEAAHVTEVTIRNRYKELTKKLSLNPI